MKLNFFLNSQLEFFNPLQERIGMKIFINDQCINQHSLIIINPGQHGFLERYIDTNAKFLFDTYEVNGNNDQVKKAIEKNGLIKVEFFTEQAYMNFGHRCKSGDYNIPTYTTNSTYTNSVRGLPNVCDYSADISGVCYSDSTCSTDFNFIETGRIEKGESSNQSFGTTTFNQNIYPFSTVEYQILPESTKQINLGDNCTMYCPSCRSRVKDNKWKFCPKCGADIQDL